MTSFAFIFGVLPLVLASGAGADMRQALGTAVFFGMLGVTVFGLFFTPTFYVLVRAMATKTRAIGATIADRFRGVESSGTILERSSAPMSNDA
jgi:HAE1 family hydrophobic/amphiphilic exporter-1